MALRLKPHTVYAKTASEVVNGDGVVEVPNFGASYAIDGQVTPAAKGVTFTRYGLDLNNPHTLLCDVTHSSRFPVGTRVLWDDRTFSVSAPVERMFVGLPADHCKVLLEELAHA